jgi:chromosome segregation ATPase
MATEEGLTKQVTDLTAKVTELEPFQTQVGELQTQVTTLTQERDTSQGELTAMQQSFDPIKVELDTAKDTIARHEIAIKEASEKVLTFETAQGRVTELEGRLKQGEESLKGISTTYLESLQFNLRTYHGMKDEQLKDKSPEQLKAVQEAMLNNVPESARQWMKTEGDDKSLGLGNSGGGSVPQSSAIEVAAGMLERAGFKSRS